MGWKLVVGLVVLVLLLFGCVRVGGCAQPEDFCRLLSNVVSQSYRVGYSTQEDCSLIREKYTTLLLQHGYGKRLSVLTGDTAVWFCRMGRSDREAQRPSRSDSVRKLGFDLCMQRLGG